MKNQEKEQEDLNEKSPCNPMPTDPPPGANPNGVWKCIDNEPVWVEDIGE